jgi:hypothetical protein
VVKLKIHGREGGAAVSPVPGTVDFVYTSVSRRDPHRGLIDIWTSRNRVAHVGDPSVVAELLNTLSMLVRRGSTTGAALDQVKAPIVLREVLEPRPDV